MALDSDAARALDINSKVKASRWRRSGAQRDPLTRARSSRTVMRCPGSGLESTVSRAPKAEGEECYQSVKWALEAGYRHVDTAEWYENEEECGRAIRDFLAESGTPRSKIFYTTKLMKNIDYDHALRALKKSLDVSGLGYIDLYLIHGPLPTKKARLASWAACQEGVRRGWARSIGVSNFGNHHLTGKYRGSLTRFLLMEIEEAGGAAPCTVNQIDLHPFMRRHALVAHQRARGVLLEAWGPLARGYRMTHPAILAVAQKHGKTAAQVFLRWGLQMGFSVIPKSVRRDRIVENTGCFGWSLDAEDMHALDGLDEHLVTDWDPSDELYP
ncbi:Aldo/keto reductase [Auricularia subglabra TFB-10046 SS5]|nr:Aldo/keto reductase [Auricularia subglabra TFB-10046 SS5]